MRTFTFVFFLLATLTAWAQQSPPQLCESRGCSKAQWEISNHFFSNSGLDKNLIGNQIYSGACYHSGHGWDPAKTHHGVAFFDYKDGDVYFGGQFSFFKTENPYGEWTPDKARQEFSKLYEKNHLVTLDIEYATAVLKESDPIWIYWFSQNPESKHIYLQALWSPTYFLLCDLAPNLR